MAVVVDMAGTGMVIVDTVMVTDEVMAVAGIIAVVVGITVADMVTVVGDTVGMVVGLVGDGAWVLPSPLVQAPRTDRLELTTCRTKSMNCDHNLIARIIKMKLGAQSLTYRTKLIACNNKL
jgi:hypothetical protein